MKASGQVSFLRFCLLMLMFVSYTDTYVFGAPKGGQVVSGTASFTQNGNLTVITAGNRAIINYQSFDIAKGETVQFVQPGAHATVLDRVLTSNPTNIFGTLQSNGIVIIANPYGVFFQNGSVVSVGGLIAGAGKISDADFTAGKIHFTDLTGDVRNDGVIAADNRIALMGANVVNTGSLTAAHGMAMMVSGPDVYVGDRNGNIFVQANGKALRAAAAAAGTTAVSAGGVANSGTVAAPRVVLGAGDMYSTAIVNSGLLQGRSIAVNAGKNGSATVGGTLDASSAHNPTATGQGGNIGVLGGTVALQGATLDASGSAGGGNVRVGGDFHGGGTLAHAATTTVDAASTIKADATGATGDGGTVVLWSDANTLFSGRIRATPGTAGGTGGQVEVSSHNALGFYGVVNAGATGSLLLDPSNIQITAGGAAVADNSNPITTTDNTPLVPPLTDTVTQAALQATTGAITLTASNDIQVADGLTGGGLSLKSTVPVVFQAGANTSLGVASTGSFVMPTTEFISNPGGITIKASGVSVGGLQGINAGNGFAIQTGTLNTSSTTGAGGNVLLQITSGTAVSASDPAPVSTGNINTGSSAGAGGNITINGSAANNAPNGITTGNLTASATGTAAGTTGVGGTVTLSTSGANGTATNALAVGLVDASSMGAAAGNVRLTISATNAVAAGNLVTPMGVGGVNTSSPAGAAGSIIIGGDGATLPTSLVVGPATNAAGTGVLDAASTGTAAGTTAAGGTITLGSSGLITVNGATSASSAGAAGGPITLVSTGGGVTATGSVSAASGVATTAASGTGSVVIDATGAVNVGTSNAAGVNAINVSSASGPGGAVTITGVTAGATTTYPTSITLGPSANTSTATNVINASAAGTAAGAGTGGAVNLTSSGAITVYGATNAGSAGGAGGAINVTSTGEDVATGDLISKAGLGGNITILAAGANGTADAISLGAIDASSTGAGGGGTVALQITSPTAVSLANPAPVSTGAINTSSAAAGAGNITINGSAANNAPNGITTGDLTANATGAAGTGGTVTLSTTGANGAGTNALSTGLIDTSSTGGAGGNVRLTIPATNAVAAGNSAAPFGIGGVTTTSSNGAAGTITIGGESTTLPTAIIVGPNTNTAATEVLDSTSTGTAAGSTAAGGAITLGSSGGITLNGGASASSSGAAGGPILLVATGGNVSSTGALLSQSAVATTGASGAGSVTINATGAVGVDTGSAGTNAINTSSVAGPGGAVNITGFGSGAAATFPSSITVGATPGSDPATTNLITSAATGTGAGNTGAGGAITLGSTGAITLYGATTASSAGAAGGAIGLTGGGAIGTGDLLSTSAVAAAGAGGTGSVSAITTGALQVNNVETSATSGPGGAIALGSNTAQPASIKVNGVLTSSGTTAGGNVGLVTTGAITLLGDVTASASAGAGGAVSMLGKGDFNGTNITTNSVGTTPGSITIGDSTTANPGFTPSGISLSGALSATNTGTGASAGNGGAIRLFSSGAVGFASASTISAAGNGGAVTVGGTATDGTSVVPNGITVGGAITTNTTGGTGAGGAVALTSSGAVGTGNITASSNGGAGGNINVAGIGTTVGALDASGSTAGGTVGVGAGTGTLMLSSANASASQGAAGGITLSGTGITSGALTANGTNNAGGNGADITATSNGGISVSGALSSAALGAAGNGGNVSLLTGATPGAVSVPGITTSGGTSGNAGNITVGAAAGGAAPTGITLGGNLSATGGSSAGTGGTVSLTTTGNLGGSSNSITTSSAIGAGGGITINSAGATIGALTSTGANGGGNVSLTSNGGITLSGAINAASTSIGGTLAGGNVDLLTGASPGAVSVQGITTASAGTGNAGSITIGKTTTGVVPTSITIGGALTANATNTGGGAGGAVTLTSGSTLGTGAITTSTTSAGAGGAVTATADGSITVSGAIDTSTTGANSGGGGNVSLLTDATATGISTPVSVQAITASSAGGTGGNILIAHDPGTAGALPPTSITVNGALTTAGVNAASAGTITLETSGAITLTAPSASGRYTLTGDTSLTGSSLAILFGGNPVTTPTFDLQNHSITLDIAAGVTVDGSIGGTTGKFDNVNNFTIATGSGTTTIDSDFTTEGSQTYGGTSTVLAATLLNGTSTATLTAGSTNTAGNLAFNASLNDSADFTHTLTLITGSASTGVLIAAPVGTAHPFQTLNATGQQSNGSALTTSEPVTINAQTVAAATQTYGSLTLTGTGATTLTSAPLTPGGSITSNGAVSATGQAFNVNATGPGGATTFNGTIGTVANPVGATDFEVAGLATFDGAINAASFALGKTTVGTEGLFTAGNATVPTVSTSAGQSYGEPVFLGAATTLTDTGSQNITLALVRSQTATAEPLTVNTAGTTTFGGTVGAGGFPLLSLTTDAPGTTQLNGGSVTTSSATGQVYNDAVTLGATGTNPSTTLTANNTGVVTFGQTLDSATTPTTTPQALTISTTGVTTFTGRVGGDPGTATAAITTAPALASLTTGTGTVNIDGGSVTTVTAPVTGGATGAQSYGGLVVIGGTTVFKGYSLVFNGGISSDTTVANNPFNLTLDLFGLLTLPGGTSFSNIRDLLSEGPGEVRFNGTVTTQGSQTYINGPLTLTGNTVLQAGTAFADSGITIGSATNPKALDNDSATGPFTLTLIAGAGPTPAGVTINEPIGATFPLASLTATTIQTTGQTTSTTGEPVTINSPTATTVQTTGSQTYGTLTLSGAGTTPTVLASTATTGAVGITVDGATTGGGNSLTASVASPAGVSSFGTINGANALNFPLGGLANFAGIGAASLGYAGGTGNFNGAVNVTNDVGVAGSASVKFASTLTAGGNVSSTGLGTTEFDGAVQANSLTVTGGTGVTLHAGTVTTTGEQNYNEAVALTSNNQLSGQGTGLGTTGGNGVALNFAQAVTGNFVLTLTNTPNQTAGGVSNTVFGGPVGTAASPLLSLSTSAQDTTFINGGGVTTNGAAGQVYNGATLIGNTTTLAAGAGPVDFKGAAATLGSAVTPQALTITTTGTTTFDAAVGGPTGTAASAVTTAPALASLTFTNNDGPVDINGQSITTVTAPVAGGATGLQNYGNSPVVLGANTLLKGYGFSFGGGVSSGTQAGTPFSLTLDFFGLTTLPGAGNVAGVGDLFTEGPGELQLGGLVATEGSQTYGNAKVTLIGNTTLQAGTAVGTGGITLNSPVDDQTLGAHTLTLITGTTSTGVTINQPIGATTPIASLTATGQQTNGSTLTTSEPVTINTASAAGVKTVGSQTYGSLILTGLGTPTLDSTGTGAGVGITVNGTVSGDGGLTATVASPTGSSSFGAITVAGPLNFSLGGTANFAAISAPSLNYAGGVGNFNGAVGVGGAVGVAGSTSVTFNSTLNAGDVTSNGTGTTTFNGPVTATSLTVTNGSLVTLHATTVTTTGEQNYNEPATLASATTLVGKGTAGNGGIAVRFGSTLTGDFALTLNNTASGASNIGSDTVFGGTVGTLASLGTSAVGTTFINGGSITTDKAAGQVYNGPVILGAVGATPTTTLAAGAGPVDFINAASSVSSAAGTLQSLVINTTGLTTFEGAVGGTPDTTTTAVTASPALGSLTTLGGGTVDINNAGVRTVTGLVPGATGAQRYSGPVLLTANAILQGNSLTLNNGLNGQGFDLTLNFASQVTLPDAITGVGAFQSVGLGGVLLNGAFATTGSQTYSNGAITLSGTSSLTTTAGDLIFNTPITGSGSLALSAPGTAAGAGQAIFNAAALVGNGATAGTSIGAFTSNTANGTIFGMTAGNSTAGNGGVNAASVAITGPVTFAEGGSTLTDNTHPSVLTTGTQTYNGAATLAQNTSLVAGASAVTFNAGASIDSATATPLNALNVNTSGTQTFSGLIGSVHALSGLTTGSGLTVFNMTIPLAATPAVLAGVLVDGPVSTTGPASFAVTNSSLAQPSVLTLGSGAQTYGAAATLPGTAIILAGPVTVLNSADTVSGGVFTGGGTIKVNGSIVSAGGTPELDVRAGVGTTVFGGSVNTTGDFSPGGASVIFNGSVGTAAAPLGVFTVQPNNGGTGTPLVDLNGGSYTTGGSMLFTLPTLLSLDTTLQAAGNITFGGSVNGNNPLNPYSLTIRLAGGTVAFNGVVGGVVPLASLTIGNVGATLGTARFAMDLSGVGANQGGVNVLGAVTINTNADFETSSATVPTILSGVTFHGVAGAGTQTYGQTGSAAAVTLGKDTILQDLATPGGITFNGTINAAAAGGAALSVNAVGDETFNALVGNTHPLASLTTDNFGTVGGTARFSMNLTPAGTVGGVRVTGPVGINDRTFLNATGGFTLPSILSGGAQNYARAVTVNQNAVLTATSGNIAFASTVDSGATAQTLQVNTPGNEVFGGLVGFTSALANLATDSAGTVGGQTQFVMTKPASGAAGSSLGGVNVNGNLVVNDAVLFQVGGTAANDPSVVSAGSQTYNGAATLGNQTLLTSNVGNIAFNSTVDSNALATPQSLTLVTSAAGSTISFAQPVGATVPLSTLTTQGSGTTQINGGSITTTADQTFDNAVTLGQDAVLRSNADITFNNTLDGSRNLEVDADNANFELVGATAPLLNLTVTAPGLTTFSFDAAPGNASVNLAGVLTVNGPVNFLAPGAGSVSFVRTGVTLPGVNIPTGQDYNGTFALQGTASFTDLKSGDITFAQAVDGFGANSNVTVGTGGTISFLGTVGATTPLASLTLNNLGVTTGEAILGGGSITTTGTQVFNDAVFLSVGTTLTSTAGGVIAFALTVDSDTAAAPQSLAVNTSGQTIFNGAVGGINPLLSLTTDNEGSTDLGTTLNGGSVTTTGAQVYNDAVTLGAATTLASTAGGSIRFASTVDSNSPATPQTLAINTSGRTVFGGLVGAVDALASLTTDNEGAADAGTFVNGGGVTTVGAQAYNDGVTLGAATTLASTASGTLVFNGTVNGAFALTLDTGGQTIFNNLVGNAAPLAALTTDNAGAAGEATQFDMSVGSAAAGVVVNGPVTINDGVFFAVKGASLTQPGVLTIGNGTQTYNGPLTLGTSTYLISAAALPAAGAAFTGGGSILFASPQGIVSAGGNDLFVRAGIGAATFASAVNARAIDLGGAAVTFRGPVNLQGTLSVEPNDNTGGGSITLNGGTITTVGAQTYNVPFVLGADTILASTGGGAITFNATVDGAHNLTLDTTGNEVFGDRVGGTHPLLSLTTDDPRFVTPGGQVIFNFAGGTTAAPSVTTVGAQVYNDAAILGADTVLASTAGGIIFAQTIDSASATAPRALTLNAAGDETFDGRVGRAAALLSLTTDDAAGTVSGGRVVFNIPGSTTALPGVTTTTFQTYNDPAILVTDTVLASSAGGALTFNSTVDSASAAAPRALTLNTAGNEVFRGLVGSGAALLSLTTDDPAANTAGGQTVFAVNGGVTTTAFQTYNDAVTLRTDTTLTSATLTFASTVDGTFALNLNTAGTTTFQGAVGSGPALASLTTAAGPLVFNGGTVTTTGVQSYGGPAVLGVDTTFTSNAAGGGIVFNSTLDSATAAAPRNLTLNAVGNETFNGRVGGTNALQTLTTDDPAAAGVSGGNVVFHIAGSSPATPGVTTVGNQTYNDAATLGLDTVLTSTGAGTLTFASTVDGTQALTLDSRGDEVFGGTVGGKVPLTSVVTDDTTGVVPGGHVFFGATGATAPMGVTTTGLQTYNDAAVLQAPTTLTSNGGGDLTFISTIDGTQTLALNSTGSENFHGQIGGSKALTSLATDADPTIGVGGAVNFYFNGTAASPSVQTTGSQVYNDPALLRADTALTSTGGRSLTFNSTVDSGKAAQPSDLVLNTTGNTVFNGLVGSSKVIKNLTLGSPLGSPGSEVGQVTFNMDQKTRQPGATNPAAVNVTGSVTVNDTVQFNTKGSDDGSPTIQSTGAQTYTAAITLGTDTVLNSSQSGALTINSPVDGGANLTLSTAGATALNGAIGNGKAGALASLTVTGSSVGLNAGIVTTTGDQSYTGATTLGQQTTTLTSRDGGITFNSTVDGNVDLVVSTTGTTAAAVTNFEAAVGSGDPLRTLTATDGSRVILSNADVTTHGLQTYGGTVDINRADGSQTTLKALDDRSSPDNTLHGNLIFKQNVTADSGSLLVQGRRILAEPDANITVVGSGNLDLEANNLLILQGTTYGSDSGKVTLNDPNDGSVPVSTPQATILLTNTRTTLFRGGKFDMGYLQNLYSLGSVTISVPGGNAALSDIAATNSLTVTAATITLHARNADQARGSAGGIDDGLNFVANNSINFGASPISYDDSHGSNNNVANFVTTGGQATVNRNQAQGISLFQDQTLAATFARLNNGLNVTDLNFDDTFAIPFQPISGGTQTIDTAAALSGALPDQKPLDVAVDITISASQLEELLKLGIHPRKAQPQERLSLASKRALFAQLVDGLDKDNYGRLQPIKGGISRLVPSDYVVVVDRMSEHEVQAILTAFEELYGKNKEKAPPIGEAFNAAFTDYTAEKQTADPAGFAPFILSKPGKYPDIAKAVRGFDNLFGYIESLGLTEKEVAKAKEHIASDLAVNGVSPEDMAKVIDTLRTKIPRNEKAPSTKLPASPPVSAPAPGATNPPPPEQKKGTPPLKTARHAKPVKNDPVHEVAGL